MADAAGQQRAGIGALLQALRPRMLPGDTLVVAADRRIAKPASEQELSYGHGAAAVLVGKGDDVAAELLGVSLAAGRLRRSLPCRAMPASITRSRSAGCATRATCRSCRERSRPSVPRPASPPRLSIDSSCKVRRVSRQAVAKAAGLRAEAIQDDLHGACGNTGVAHPLLQLGAALETAAAGEIVLLASFGQGCDALLLRATGRAPATWAGRHGCACRRRRGPRLPALPRQLRPRRNRLGHARRA